MKHKEGDLVSILDDSGDIVGIALYCSTFKPIDRSASDIPEDFKEPFNETHWHHEVLVEGKLTWLHASHFTLLGVKDESR